MSILPFRSVLPEAETETIKTQPFSFDISQPDAKGFVYIDACVPMALAVAFMELLTAYKLDL